MQLLNLTYSAWGDELLQVLNTMRTTNDMCDVRLVLSDQVLQAHSCVLSAASPFFKSIFSGTENLEINLEDFPSGIVMHVLDFVYSGSSLFPKEDLEKLHSVATTLNIPGLVDLTQEMLTHSVPEDVTGEEDPDSCVNMELASMNRSEFPDLSQDSISVANEHLVLKIEQKTMEQNIPDVSEVMSDEVVAHLKHFHGTEESSAIEFSQIVDQIASSNMIDTSEQDAVNGDDGNVDPDANHIHNSQADEYTTFARALEIVEGTDISAIENKIEEIEYSDVSSKVIKTEHKKLMPCMVKHVKDTVIPLGTPGRATHTIPHGLTIKMTVQPSNHNITQSGVHTILSFPKDSLFGPYEGEIYKEIDPENLANREHCWKIYKDGKYLHYLDGENELHANWMRYVRQTSDPKEQNLEAFQNGGALYFKATKDIQQFSELIVKYGNPQSTVLRTVITKSSMDDQKQVTSDVMERLKLSCDECGIIYKTEIIYHRHMQVKHGKGLPLEIYEINEKERSERQSKFINQELGVKSEDITKEFSPPRVTRSSDRKTKLKEITKPKKELITCTVCGKMFNTLSSLKIHAAIHSNQRQYACPTCDRAFVQKSNLTTHMKIHTKDRSFVCSNCGKGFLRKSELKTHEKFHSPENHYSCKECGKGFKTSGNLTRHMRCHSGEKPYSCSICDRDFNRSENLKTHMRKHTGEKPFQCSRCGNCFTENSHLQSHMRRHTGEKPYQCDLCGKAFVEITGLQVHSKSHTRMK